MKASSALAFPFAVLGSLPAQAPVAPPHHLAPAAVCIDPAPDGTVLARGRTYKLAATGNTVTYYPRFPNADRHTPLMFRLAAATAGDTVLALTTGSAVTVDGHRLTVDRGAVRELWDLDAETAELSFALASAPPGDLRLQVAVDTGLEAGGDERTRTWNLPGHGDVQCSDAVVRDAAGRTLPLAMTATAGGFTLTVPAAFAAQAQWPLVVDPLIRTFSLDRTASQLAGQRVAYDPGTDTWLVVCQEGFNTADRDIEVLRLDRDGNVLDTTFADQSTADTAPCDVADATGPRQFLIAWVDRTNHTVRRRTRSAANTTYSIPTTQALNVVTLPERLAIGGAPTGDRFLLVASGAIGLLAGGAVDAAMVDVAGNTLGAATLLAATPSSIIEVACSPLAAADSRWGVALAPFELQRGTQSLSFLTVDDLVAGGTLVTTQAVALRGFQVGVGAPTVAPSGNDFAVGFLDGLPTHAHLGLLQAIAPGVFVSRSDVDITVLQHGAGTTIGYNSPQFVGDGCRIALLHREGATVRASTMRLSVAGNGLATVALDENVRSLAIGVPNPGDLAFAMADLGSVATGRCLAVWGLQLTAGQFDLDAGLYDARTGGAMFTTTATACGSTGTSPIAASGTTALGGQAVIGMDNPLGVPVLVVGLPLATPVAVCSVSACRRGVQLPALGYGFGGRLAIQIPCVPGLLGGSIAVQGFDLGPGDACPAAQFGTPYRVTDTIRLDVR